MTTTATDRLTIPRKQVQQGICYLTFAGVGKGVIHVTQFAMGWSVQDLKLKARERTRQDYFIVRLPAHTTGVNIQAI